MGGGADGELQSSGPFAGAVPCGGGLTSQREHSDQSWACRTMCNVLSVGQPTGDSSFLAGVERRRAYHGAHCQLGLVHEGFNNG